MPMTIVVTRDVEARYRGFLTSVMLEIAPGVYCRAGPVRRCAPTGMGRRRVLVVVLGRGAIVMVWRDVTASGHLRIETLGEPPKEIVDADGVLLLKRVEDDLRPFVL